MSETETKIKSATTKDEEQKRYETYVDGFVSGLAMAKDAADYVKGKKASLDDLDFMIRKSWELGVVMQEQTDYRFYCYSGEIMERLRGYLDERNQQRLDKLEETLL
jgi:hypothetical protein